MGAESRIVVLGGTGFVGGVLVPALLRRGHQVDVLSRNRELARDLAVLPGVRLLSTDVYSVDALAARLEGAAAVVNLVGVLQNDGFGGGDFQRAHVQLTETLIAAMRKAGVQRLLQMSALRAGEGASHYLRTRGAAEALVQASGLQWTLFRPSVIFGPGDGLYNRFASLLTIAPVLPLARAGASFQPVYVKDVAEAMARALERPETVGRNYPLVGPKRYSLAEIVRYTAALRGLRRWVIGLPDLLGRLQALAFDPLPAALKPFSSDNFKSLALDSTSERSGLEELGITPTPVEHIVPRYLAGSHHQRALDRYRAERG